MAKKKPKTSENEQSVVDSKKKGKGNKKGKDEVASDDNRSSKQQSNRAKVTSMASWTGKLPHTLLHEKCQKLKWNKVEYDMKRIGDKGMLAVAQISYTDPKSKETLTLRMDDPTFDRATSKGVITPQDTPIEARHFAATVALYRIGYNTNLHMMLPPNHKKVWYELDDFRKQMEKENMKRAKKLFDVDPFKTLLEERKNKAQALREKESRDKQEEKLNKGPILITRNEQNLPQKTKLSHSKSLFSRKQWENATFIDFDEQMRERIERFLRHHIDWNDQKFNMDHDSSREELKNKLLSLGFRKSHVEEAMYYRDPLSFLIYNVPEDDFPDYFRKRQEETKNKIEIASLPLPKRNMIDRLMELGTSYDETKLALEQCGYDEAKACVQLLCGIYEISPIERTMSIKESDDLWAQEVASLRSIYQDTFEEINAQTFSIYLGDELNIKVKIYRSEEYPFMIPGIVVSTFSKKFKLPTYIKIILLRKLLHHIDSLFILGDMLLFHIIDWIESNISQIIEDPGPLLDNEILEGHNKNAIKVTTSNARKRTHTVRPLNETELLSLKHNHDKRTSSPEYQKILEQRSKLPAWKKRKEIIDLISQNTVVLITGETGSGKSTQVVQFILDNLMKEEKIVDIKIICTQPRRISAIGLAERVAEERLVTCGDEVGYVIRGVDLSSRLTRIRFMTTGILVKILQNDSLSLRNSIVVIDEVHERSLDTDLIITLLKNLLRKIPGLKIVLMSATVDTSTFRSFFEGLKSIHIEGRTFPIQDFFLEDILTDLEFKIKKNSYFVDDDDSEESQFIVPKADSRFFAAGRINYDLICETVNHIHHKLVDINNDGSILIFLPGVGEVNSCCNLIRNFDGENQFEVLPLHSALSPEDQKCVFKRFNGKRKIVVSTNIAETSITIDDCVATIDTGRMKTLTYDATSNTSKLVEKFESKAEAKQRRGRAGRVRAGFSYKLFSRDTYDTMDEQPQPEIKRVTLESLYLSVRSMGVKDVFKFLQNGLDPPPLASLKKAEQILTTLGLLSYEDKRLTELGKMISLMPVIDSKHGKLLIYSIIFGCTDIGVLIASILSLGGSPFINEFDNRDKIRSILSESEKLGDVLAITKVVTQCLSLSGSQRKKFMKNNCLSMNKLNEIISSRTQYYSILKDIGLLPFSYKPNSSSPLNRNSNNFKILKCVLTGSFYPNVARVQLPDPKFVSTSVGAIEIDPDKKLTKYWIRNEEYAEKMYEDNTQSIDTHVSMATRAFIHPSSLLFSQGNSITEDAKTLDGDGKMTKKNSSLNSYNSPFLVFNGIHHTSKIYLRNLTPTSTFAILLFGGNLRYDLDASSYSPGMVVDNWLPIRTWCKNGLILKELRYLVDRLIKEKLEKPHYYSIVTSSQDVDILQEIEEIIKSYT